MMRIKQLLYFVLWIGAASILSGHAVAQGLLVMEVGKRPALLPDIEKTVSTVLGETIANPIREPQLNRVRNALIVVSKDRVQNMADLALDHLERIGRQGRMATGSTVQIYEDKTGNKVSKVGKFVCEGNNVILPEGAQPVSGQGYFVSSGMGAAGGTFPTPQHPNAPRIGTKAGVIPSVVQNNGAGEAGGPAVGRVRNSQGGTPELIEGYLEPGNSFVMKKGAAQDGFRNEPGKLGITKTKKGAAEEVQKKISPEMERPRGVSSDADFWKLQEKNFFLRQETLPGNVFPNVFASLPEFSCVFALTQDVARGNMEAYNKWNPGQQNSESFATHQLTGLYWSLWIQDDINASALVLADPDVITERKRIQALSSVMNALFVEMNRGVGVLAIEGRSESIGDIKGQSVVNTAR